MGTLIEFRTASPEILFSALLRSPQNLLVIKSLNADDYSLDHIFGTRRNFDRFEFGVGGKKSDMAGFLF